MLKFKYKQTICERVVAKCSKHPRYNPERDGYAGIKGMCSTCCQLYKLHEARTRLDVAIREFTRLTGPWRVLPKPRRSATTNPTKTSL